MDVPKLARAWAKYQRMVIHSTLGTQAMIERYGERTMDEISKLETAQQVEVFAQAKQILEGKA